MKRISLSDRAIHLGLIVCAILTLTASWLPIVFNARSYASAASRYWWLADDILISMRYARNFAHGAGLVWNVGERVEGFSNFLWTLYLSALHILPIPVAQISLAVLLTNVALGALTLGAIFRLARALDGNLLGIAAALAGFAINRDALNWATLGYETTLVTCLFTLALGDLVRGVRWQTFALIAALALARADAIVLCALLYALALILHRDKRRVLAGIAASLLAPLAYQLFRLSYYGAWVPNTAELKVFNWDTRFVAGVLYAGEFIFAHAFLLITALAVGVFTRDARLRWMLVGIAAYALYIIYIGGDTSRLFRFFAPILPTLLVIAFIGISNRAPRVVAIIIFIVCLATIPRVNPITELFNRANANPNRDVETALLIAQNTAPTSRIADFMAGATFYFSERPGIDLLGKVDAHIARLAAKPGLLMPGHNKWDFEYSIMQLKPDLVIAPASDVMRDESLRASTYGKWYPLFTQELYAHPGFRDHCLPNPITHATNRAVFVCDWSPELARKNAWRALGE
ncbi:MAG: hypothetical protein HZC40_10385 [Chloroflexi bacterium]|nr:hypothetical protein [Chloroflexota bacterium]